MKSVRPTGKAPIVGVPPKQRQAIEDVIMEAFLAGTDDNFDRLLEASFTASLVAQVHCPKCPTHCFITELSRIIQNGEPAPRCSMSYVRAL